MRFANLPLSAQTAYAELFSQAQGFEMTNALAGLTGAFHRRELKGRDYWYFGYRDIDRKLRMVYVGPDSERVRALVGKFEQVLKDKPLVPPARMAFAAGCAPAAPKHFRIIKRLADYGFFRAGGILVGTHAFLAMGNMLGVRWQEGSATLDVDLAHAGRNISVALPANLRIDVHGALESLEMGLLPIMQFDGRAGAQYRNPRDQELRLDFVTSKARGHRFVVMKDLNLALEPLKFMEFSLEQTTQGCVFSNLGACVVNLPAPERFAVHKLIVHGERPMSERAKAVKDLLQAASIASYFLAQGQAEVFNAAWRDARGRGRGWRSRAEQGRKAMLRIAPDLADEALWA
ncbi:MAG: nucleotidyltransferase domain-containing protein [Rhodocyclaceae bacterium]|nr:nucleotidyltransferase domain-containing protein [Rhodocyclaceae bacterium]